MISLPHLLVPAMVPPRPSTSRWGDELWRHDWLSLAVGAALTLTALATALSLTFEGITHPRSLIQLAVVSVLLVAGQAGALAATLLHPLWLRLPGTVVSLGAMLLMDRITMGGLWIVPAATALVLLLHRSLHTWLRGVSAGTALFAAAALALWAHQLSATALVRTPILLASLLALAAAALLLGNLLLGRDTWGSLLLGSALTLGIGGLIGFTGSIFGAAAAGEDSMSFLVFAVDVLGMTKLDLVLAMLVAPVLGIIALVRLWGGSADDDLSETVEVSPVVAVAALALAALTLLPALAGLFGDGLGAVAGFLADAVYLIVWAGCAALWFTRHREVVDERLPLTALTLDHALVIVVIVLSPLLRGILAWLDLMISGGMFHDGL